jgi:hypothetical protein
MLKANLRCVDIEIDGECVPVQLRLHRRSKNYILRVGDDGEIQMTVPRFGTHREAQAFAMGQREWLVAQIREREIRRRTSRLVDGSTFLFRGLQVTLSVEEDLFGSTIRFGDQIMKFRNPPPDLKAAVTRHLRGLARKEIPPRVIELASDRGLEVPAISIRAQKTLWGSCSQSGRLSLNWKLILPPDWVRDYVIIHELMHLFEFNHSDSFWERVAEAFPEYREAECWLKTRGERIW